MVMAMAQQTLTGESKMSGEARTSLLVKAHRGESMQKRWLVSNEDATPRVKEQR